MPTIIDESGVPYKHDTDQT